MRYSYFHDDQHGTAVVTLAGLYNALKIVGKKKEQVRIVLNGAGAAAISITKLLLADGFRHIVLCDRNGMLYEGRKEGMNFVKEEAARLTNREKGRALCRTLWSGRMCLSVYPLREF